MKIVFILQFTLLWQIQSASAIKVNQSRDMKHVLKSPLRVVVTLLKPFLYHKAHTNELSGIDLALIKVVAEKLDLDLSIEIMDLDSLNSSQSMHEG